MGAAGRHDHYRWKARRDRKAGKSGKGKLRPSKCSYLLSSLIVKEAAMSETGKARPVGVEGTQGS